MCVSVFKSEGCRGPEQIQAGRMKWMHCVLLTAVNLPSMLAHILTNLHCNSWWCVHSHISVLLYVVNQM